MEHGALKSVGKLPSAESAYGPKADSYRWLGVRLSNLQRYIDTGARGQPICGEGKGPARARRQAADILLAVEKATEAISAAVEMAVAGQVQEGDVCCLAGKDSLLTSIRVCVVPACTHPPFPGYRGMCKKHYELCRGRRPDLAAYLESSAVLAFRMGSLGRRRLGDVSGFGVHDRVAKRIAAMLRDFDDAETEARRESVRKEVSKMVLATALLVSSVIVPLGEILCAGKTSLADMEEADRGQPATYFPGPCLAGCGKPATTRGLCRLHYQQAWRGDAGLAALMLPPCPRDGTDARFTSTDPPGGVQGPQEKGGA